MNFSEWLTSSGNNVKTRIVDHPQCSDCYKPFKEQIEYVASRKRLILAGRSRLIKELEQIECWVAQLHYRGSDDAEYFLRNAREMLHVLNKIGTEK